MMTVAELITLLQAHPQDARVLMDMDWTYQPVTAVGPLPDNHVAIR